MRFLRLLIAVLIVGLLLAGRAARYLVVDAPQKSDAIVVLAGETNAREARALDLLRQGMAPRLFVDAEAGEQIYDQPLTGIAQRYLRSLPESDRLSVCAITGRSTVAETADVARCLQPVRAQRVLLVTSDYHSRRALAIFSRRLPQYQWSMAAARNPAAFGDAWWTHREWAKTTFDEWTKLIWWEAVDRWKNGSLEKSVAISYQEQEILTGNEQLATGYWQLLSSCDSLEARHLEWRIHGKGHGHGKSKRSLAGGGP